MRVTLEFVGQVRLEVTLGLGRGDGPDGRGGVVVAPVAKVVRLLSFVADAAGKLGHEFVPAPRHSA